MQFQQRFARGIAEGSIDLTFRRWKRSQAKAGNTYRTAAGRIVVDEVTLVTPNDVTDAEAVRAGFASAEALFERLPGDADLPLHRVRFHPADGPDPRDELAAAADLSAADREAIDERLARLDAASSRGAWTKAVLRALAARPGTRAADLAGAFGLDTDTFKRDVRKLKALGLTESLETGYRLSPRGTAYLGDGR